MFRASNFLIWLQKTKVDTLTQSEIEHALKEVRVLALTAKASAEIFADFFDSTDLEVSKFHLIFETYSNLNNASESSFRAEK